MRSREGLMTWDYVVLQQGPTTTLVNRDTLVIATKTVDPYVKAAGGRTAILMPWPHIDEPHLFNAVRQSALVASQSVTGGVFLPVGEAWLISGRRGPHLFVNSLAHSRHDSGDRAHVGNRCTEVDDTSAQEKRASNHGVRYEYLAFDLQRGDKRFIQLVQVVGPLFDARTQVGRDIPECRDT